MKKQYLRAQDLSSYKLALSLSNRIWKIVAKWRYFEKNTVGMQLVRSIDSVSANIAEGFGRYSKKDKIRFYRIALASQTEVEDWLRKCSSRMLIRDDDYLNLVKELEQLPKEIYN